MVAHYADGCNLFGDPERARHLIGVLEGHCEKVGRDASEITKTAMAQVCIGATHEAAQAKFDTFKGRIPPERVAMFNVGDPDTIAERAQKFADVGIEGLTIGLPDVHDPEAIELAGKAISQVFAPSAVA
jgi:alkanesulfonate monooxygenase SsuD/methylene tetrahydromethanopterin reductase-like flavin-dependent oxidoreductase (luciferase family)